ncbi:uncharacterized protein [Primulina eburnea]|uniref:uncharacterized protein n=1 Tax=Primulina eburnea TaxID=1245227 RepID=UPI003C6BE512
MAGLRINPLKSSIYMGSIDESVRQEIVDITSFSPGSLPFRYLGIPLVARRLCASDYSKLVDATAMKFRIALFTRFTPSAANLCGKKTSSYCLEHTEWRRRKDESPLIKKILDIRDELITRTGSADAAISCLMSWFGKKDGLDHAYQFFVGKETKWPWKPILSKSFLMPKHRFILWLFAHRKLMTRDRLGYISDRKCVLYEIHDELVAHLFFECGAAKVI